MLDFIAKIIRWVGIIAAATMALSFVLFAANEGKKSSNRQVEIIAGADPSKADEQLREREHTRARELVDDANDYLSKPFTWVTENSSSLWVQRGVTFALGLIVFGFGLPFLANLIPKTKPREPTAWQT